MRPGGWGWPCQGPSLGLSVRARALNATERLEWKKVLEMLVMGAQHCGCDQCHDGENGVSVLPR